MTFTTSSSSSSPTKNNVQTNTTTTTQNASSPEPTYTLGIIRCKENNKILLINREIPPHLGRWFGIGGEIKTSIGSPIENLKIQTNEQTGLDLNNFKSRGILKWEIYNKPDIKNDNSSTTSKYEEKIHKIFHSNLKNLNIPVSGSLYIFTSDISITQFENYRTPLTYNKNLGILDWKNLDWCLNEFNYGIVDFLKFLLPNVFNCNENDLFIVKYHDLDLVETLHEPSEGNKVLP
ncbi:uncharacterized protein KGF55_004649 [Candida pseudojiufengensis]|uniref:uncharacterized protein n=1 Tax=Candida pseudojiufengensis TaxID=497109 RepID=UPI002225365C|nr:uncharacterized protein KGF55_004649 [Candida pseudojiufengensis]KAI5960357.1 hypothetical protein KGF55_004649 [Candida pseudojiufengensis]